MPEPAVGLVPHLVVNGGAAAIEFYKKAFGAVETCRLTHPGGGLVHAAVKIGDSDLMLAEESPAWGSLAPISLKGSPVTLHLVVPDVDASVAGAVDAGAKLTMPVSDMFWGDRYGQVVDPFGHRWSIATPQRSLSQEEMQAAMLKAMPGGCG